MVDLPETQKIPRRFWVECGGQRHYGVYFPGTKALVTDSCHVSVSEHDDYEKLGARIVWLAGQYGFTCCGHPGGHEVNWIDNPVVRADL